MPNKNYINGAARERKIVNLFRSAGCMAFRSAGSHSACDLVAVNFFAKEIYFIQVKPKSMSDNKKNRIEQENNHLNGNFKCHFKCVSVFDDIFNDDK